MNPDDMTDEQVAAMITAVRAMLERLEAEGTHDLYDVAAEFGIDLTPAAEDFTAWEQELATPGWADR